MNWVGDATMFEIVGHAQQSVAMVNGTYATTGTHGLYSTLQEQGDLVTIGSFDESCLYLDAWRQVTAFFNGPTSTFFYSLLLFP